MLFQKLKNERLEALKQKDELRKNLLGTLIAEATKQTKDPPDEDVTSTIRGFIKNAGIVIKNLEATPNDPRLETARKEVGILQGYLPSQLTGDALRKAIVYALKVEDIPQDIKNMGKVMKALGTHYPDRYNGKEASDLVREVLAAEG